MEQRLDFYHANPNAIKAMLALEDRIGKSSLEKPLAELVRLRASQINGCAFCVDMHTMAQLVHMLVECRFEPNFPKRATLEPLRREGPHFGNYIARVDVRRAEYLQRTGRSPAL